MAFSLRSRTKESFTDLVGHIFTTSDVVSFILNAFGGMEGIDSTPRHPEVRKDLGEDERKDIQELYLLVIS